MSFVVEFADGHIERFDCILDAHDRMNAVDSGALQTVNEMTGEVTARPAPFDYLPIWRAGW